MLQQEPRFQHLLLCEVRGSEGGETRPAVNGLITPPPPVPRSPTGLLVANPEPRGLASSFSAHYTYTLVPYPDTAVASPACFATEWDGVATAAARFATEGASFATSQGRVATKPWGFATNPWSAVANLATYTTALRWLGSYAVTAVSNEAGFETSLGIAVAKREGLATAEAGSVSYPETAS
jgi:hypothetical protein